MRVDDVPPQSAFHELIGVDGRGYETAMWPEKLESFKFQKRRFYWCPQCDIDTTFGMRRKGSYKRLDGRGARLMPPYGARHLDWYFDVERVPEDMLFYLCTQKLASAIATHSYPLVSGFNCSEFIANITAEAVGAAEAAEAAATAEAATAEAATAEAAATATAEAATEKAAEAAEAAEAPTGVEAAEAAKATTSAEAATAATAEAEAATAAAAEAPTGAEA